MTTSKRTSHDETRTDMQISMDVWRTIYGKCQCTRTRTGERRYCSSCVRIINAGGKA